VPAFRVKLGTNELNCVDVPLNPTHSHSALFCIIILLLLLHFVIVLLVCMMLVTATWGGVQQRVTEIALNKFFRLVHLILCSLFIIMVL